MVFPVIRNYFATHLHTTNFCKASASLGPLRNRILSSHLTPSSTLGKYQFSKISHSQTNTKLIKSSQLFRTFASDSQEPTFKEKIQKQFDKIGIALRQKYDELKKIDKEKVKKIVNDRRFRLVIVGLIAYLVYDEKRDDLERTKKKEEEVDVIIKLREFVQQFNKDFQNSNGNEESNKTISSHRAEAIKQILHYRTLGNLSPRQHSHPNKFLSSLAFLTLTEADDIPIKYFAFKNLKMLLRQKYDPTESIGSLLSLEHRIGQMLLQMNEIDKPVPFMHEQVSCYNLVLEKIFLSLLHGGSAISNNDRDDVYKRATAICKRLEKNVAFQYEAHSASVLSQHLQTPSQPVSETLRAIFSIDSLIKENKEEWNAILLESASLAQGVDKLRQFLTNAPSVVGQGKEYIDRLLLNWDTGKTDLYASMLMSRPDWSSSFSNNGLDVLKRALQQAKASKNDWLPLFRIVTALSEIVLSKAEETVRRQAFNEITGLIDSTTPWQVRYKIATILFQLKTDLYFQHAAMAELEKHKSVKIPPVTISKRLFSKTDPNSALQNSLTYFESIQDKLKGVDQILKGLRVNTLGKLSDRIRDAQAADFIPRENNLSQIANQFYTYNGSDTAIQIIYAMRGFGKTTLAASYAEKYLGDYAEVYWLDAKSLDEDIKFVADQIDIPKVDAASGAIKSLDERKLMLQKRLEDKKNHGWLLIIDDVSPKDCEKIKSFLPSTGGHLLMTTYQPAVLPQFPYHYPKELHGFSEMESQHYLLQGLSSTEENRKYASDISRDLLGLPSALSAVKTYINKTGCSFQDYAKFHQSNRKKYLKSTYGPWIANFEKAREKYPLVSKLLPFLAELNPNDIPASLIVSWVSIINPNTDENEIFDALGGLIDFDLIKGRNSLYSIHQFVQEAIKSSLENENKANLGSMIQTFVNTVLFQEEEPPKILLAVEKVMNTINEDDNKSWAKIEQLIPHCTVLAEKYTATNCLKITSMLHRKISRYYYHMGDYNNAQTTIEKAITEAEKFYKKREHLDIALGLFQLADIMRNQGRLKTAEGISMESLDIRKKIHKSDDNLEVAASFYQLGIILRRQNRLEEAETKLQTSLKIRKKIHGTEEHLNISAVLLQLGNICMQKKDFMNAKNYFEKALGLNRKILKNDEHDFIATSLHRLGAALQSLGDVKRAGEHFELALQILKRIYKPDHPKIKKVLFSQLQLKENIEERAEYEKIKQAGWEPLS